MPPASSAKSRPLSLGVIFLTLYIDLIGFSIIFPLVPDILAHYLGTEGSSGLLGSLVDTTTSLLGLGSAAAGWEFHPDSSLFVRVYGTITTPGIITTTVAGIPACMKWAIIGICFWLKCGLTGCSIETGGATTPRTWSSSRLSPGMATLRTVSITWIR